VSRFLKNPLHPSALAVNDLTVGRHVLLYNCDVGIVEEGVVVSRPAATVPRSGVNWDLVATMAPAPQVQAALEQQFRTPRLSVDIRSLDTGEVTCWQLDAIGVIPFPSRYSEEYVPPRSAHDLPWSMVNCVIDADKRSLLPAAQEPATMHDAYERLVTALFASMEWEVEQEEQEEGD